MIYKGSIVKGSGGGSGGDVNWGDIGGTLSDQTDLQTALNAKQDTLTAGSGIDITNDVISATVSGLQNTATGTNSLTILGTATTAANATNIGVTSGVTGNYSTAVGYGAGVTSGATRAIQIGEGTNSVSNTFSVGFGVNNYQLLNGSTGKIPNDRLNAFTGATSSVAGGVGAVPAPTTSDVNKYLKGDGTWAEAGGSISYDDATINENASNELQAIGVKEARTDTAIRFWHGTEAQYNVGGEVKDTYYNWDNIVGNTITMPSSAAWQDIAESNGNLVAIAYESDTCAYSSDAGANWSSSTLPSTEKWNAITSGNGKFIAIDGYGKSAYTNDNGATWSAGGNLPALTNQNQNANWYGLAFGDGRFVAIDRSTGRTAYTDDNGITWVQGGDLPITGMQIAYGNGVFIVVASFTDIYAYSTDGGETWISGIMPYSGNWKSVVFGNGVFMTIDQGSGKVLTTDNGQNWTFVSVSNVGSKICYGDGIFFSYNRYGIDNITIHVGYTKDNGATWNYKSFAYVGNIPSFKGLVYSEDKFIGLIPNSTISYTYAINSVYTLDETPTTASTVYSTPAVTSALTITAVGTGTITLSDTNTYDYNAGGNQNSYYTVGESYPNYVCFIDGVGVKLGTTTIATATTVSQTYDATSTDAISGVGVAQALARP